jgi:hypothetical protein
MLKEHLSWIQQVKKDSVDSRCKDIVEKLKRLESKIDTILKEDFDKINMDQVTKVSFGSLMCLPVQGLADDGHIQDDSLA